MTLQMLGLNLILLQSVSTDFNVTKLDLELGFISGIIAHSRSTYALVFSGSKVFRFEDSEQPKPFELADPLGAAMNAYGVVSVIGYKVEGKDPTFARTIGGGSRPHHVIDQFVLGSNGFLDTKQYEVFKFDGYRIHHWAPNMIDGESTLACLAYKDKKHWIGRVAGSSSHPVKWFELKMPPNERSISGFTSIAGGFLFGTSNASEVSLWHVDTKGASRRLATKKATLQGRLDGEEGGSRLESFLDGKRFLWIVNESLYYGSLKKPATVSGSSAPSPTVPLLRLDHLVKNPDVELDRDDNAFYVLGHSTLGQNTLQTVGESRSEWAVLGRQEVPCRFPHTGQK